MKTSPYHKAQIRYAHRICNVCIAQNKKRRLWDQRTSFCALNICLVSSYEDALNTCDFLEVFVRVYAMWMLNLNSLSNTFTVPGEAFTCTIMVRFMIFFQEGYAPP